ncbi:hypothetical protein C6B37_01850, partial [Candidatus Phytoplasma phoenicium]
MNIIGWFKNKLMNIRRKNKIEILPIVFDSSEGRPFRKEKYIVQQQEKKIEFFYLTQSNYYLNFMQIKQYVVWTLKNDVCRVFITEDFYKKFELFYQKEINTIYLSFLYDISIRRLYIYQKFKFLFSILLLIFLSFLGFFIFLGLDKLIFLLIFLFSFLVFFIFFAFRLKLLLKYKKNRLNEARKEVRIFLGSKK